MSWKRECTGYAKINKAITVQPNKREWYLLEGSLLLERAINFKYKEIVTPVQVCGVKIYFNDPFSEDEDYTPSRTSILVEVESYTKADDEDGPKCVLNATLNIHVSSKIKNNLFAAVNNNLQLKITGLLDAEWEASVEIDNYSEAIDYPIHNPHIIWQFGEDNPPAWYESAKYQISWAAFESFPLNNYSQTYKIYSDFAKNYSNSKIFVPPRPVDVFAVNQLISNVRSALRPFEREHEDAFFSIWSQSPEWAKRYATKLPVDDAEVFCKKYDQLWSTFTITTLLQRGEENYGAVASGYEPKVDELESAAKELLQLPNGCYSYELENLLINALIYAETTAFAQYVYSKNKLFGEKIASPIKGIDSDSVKQKGILFVITHAVALTAKNVFTEFGKIGLAFVFAYIVTGQNLTATWLITTGLTLYRWLEKLLIQLKGTDRQKEIDLVIAMAQLHEMSNKPDFSANILYQELIRVTQFGARLSPAVANLLERRLAVAYKN